MGRRPQQLILSAGLIRKPHDAHNKLTWVNALFKKPEMLIVKIQIARRTKVFILEPGRREDLLLVLKWSLCFRGGEGRGWGGEGGGCRGRERERENKMSEKEIEKSRSAIFQRFPGDRGRAGERRGGIGRAREKDREMVGLEEFPSWQILKELFGLGCGNILPLTPALFFGAQNLAE